MDTKIVNVLSSMRAGSTLLKALLATRTDILDIPESQPTLTPYLQQLTDKIIIIKNPAYFNEQGYVKKFETKHSKYIILVRNPYDTILSLYKMSLETIWQKGIFFTEYTLLNYWKSVYLQIIDAMDTKLKDALIVNYESLVSDPFTETERIFSFLGVEDTSGTKMYQKPLNYDWQWGKDDGGEKIKSMIVQETKSLYSNKKLLTIIHNDRVAQFILNVFGYQNICPEVVSRVFSNQMNDKKLFCDL